MQWAWQIRMNKQPTRLFTLDSSKSSLEYNHHQIKFIGWPAVKCAFFVAHILLLCRNCRWVEDYPCSSQFFNESWGFLVIALNKRGLNTTGADMKSIIQEKSSCKCPLLLIQFGNHGQAAVMTRNDGFRLASGCFWVLYGKLPSVPDFHFLQGRCQDEPRYGFLSERWRRCWNIHE